MIEIKYNMDRELANRLEDHFAESEVSGWVLTDECDIKEPMDPGNSYISGYFQTELEALKNWRDLQAIFTELPENPDTHLIEDKDWKEAYKQHYKPWHFGGLHWVPEWYKGSYAIPKNEDAVYLDPGMAFGMSDHPSTRLCLLSLIRYRDRWETKLKGKVVMDAGCGSGILALSAAKLGFQNIYAFDNDPVAIDNSCKNCSKNGLDRRVSFELADLETALFDRAADLIFANILSGVLCRYAKSLLLTLNPCGSLILSGMFEKELEEMKEVYGDIIKHIGMKVEMDVNVLNDWCSLVINRV